jgi:hypothetical protein
MELTQCLTLIKFPQTFLTNPLKLKIYLCMQNSYCDHRNSDSVKSAFMDWEFFRYEICFQQRCNHLLLYGLGIFSMTANTLV